MGHIQNIEEQNNKAKKIYRTPELKEFGSIQEQTLAGNSNVTFDLNGYS